MNKKILFLILSGTLVLPGLVCAETQSQGVKTIADAIVTAIYAIGFPLVAVGWVIAGILYLTSMGNPQQTETGKKALIAAVIGTILVIVSSTAIALVKTTFGL